jgi:hypothetical protein
MLTEPWLSSPLSVNPEDQHGDLVEIGYEDELH